MKNMRQTMNIWVDDYTNDLPAASIVKSLESEGFRYDKCAFVNNEIRDGSGRLLLERLGVRDLRVPEKLGVKYPYSLFDVHVIIVDFEDVYKTAPMIGGDREIITKNLILWNPERLDVKMLKCSRHLQYWEEVVQATILENEKDIVCQSLDDLKKLIELIAVDKRFDFWAEVEQILGIKRTPRFRGIK
jgi:hypothetical protein